MSLPWCAFAHTSLQVCSVVTQPSLSAARAVISASGIPPSTTISTPSLPSDPTCCRTLSPTSAFKTHRSASTAPRQPLPSYDSIRSAPARALSCSPTVIRRAASDRDLPSSGRRFAEPDCRTQAIPQRNRVYSDGNFCESNVVKKPSERRFRNFWMKASSDYVSW